MKRFTIVCGPWNDSNKTLGNRCACVVCGSKVWLSDTSLSACAQSDSTITIERIRILCIPCGQEIMEKEKIPVAPLSEEQQAELLKHIKNGDI